MKNNKKNKKIPLIIFFVILFIGLNVAVLVKDNTDNRTFEEIIEAVSQNFDVRSITPVPAEQCEEIGALSGVTFVYSVDESILHDTIYEYATPWAAGAVFEKEAGAINGRFYMHSLGYSGFTIYFSRLLE